MFASSRQTLLLILKDLDIQRCYAANTAERGDAEFLANGVIARLSRLFFADDEFADDAD